MTLFSFRHSLRPMWRQFSLLLVGFIGAALLACAPASAENSTAPARATPSSTPSSNSATAVFAGGCFWCMEQPFDQMAGVISTTSGFSGGNLANPSYDQVSHGNTGHVEAVLVTYDPRQTSYAQLLETYWRQVDPFDGGGQFCDRGATYAPVIFVANANERAQAEASKNYLQQRFGRNIAVQIRARAPFYAAEDYHQNFYQTNERRYRFYRSGCGRDRRLTEVWGQSTHH